MWRASAGDLYRFRAALRLRLGCRGPTVTMLAAERYVEIPTLLRWLAPRPPERLLDCGSARSVVPSYVAARYGIDVWAVDRWAEVAGQRQIAMALGFAASSRQRAADPEEKATGSSPTIHVVQADLTALPFDDGCFDAALAVSTIEHVEDDSAALRALARVLRPGGSLALSVPFAPATSERWRTEAIYDRAPTDGAVFFERIYDAAALEARLVGPSGLRLEGRAIFAWRGRDVAHAARLQRFPLRGLAELWRGSRAFLVTPERLHADEPAVCCLLLRRPQ